GSCWWCPAAAPGPPGASHLTPEDPQAPRNCSPVADCDGPWTTHRREGGGRDDGRDVGGDGGGGCQVAARLGGGRVLLRPVGEHPAKAGAGRSPAGVPAARRQGADRPAVAR